DADDPIKVIAVSGGSVGISFQLASGAMLTLNGDGSYIYDPSTITILSQLSSGSFHDTFTYTASDGHGDTSTAIVDITVNVVSGDHSDDDHGQGCRDEHRHDEWQHDRREDGCDHWLTSSTHCDIFDDEPRCGNSNSPSHSCNGSKWVPPDAHGWES